MVANSRTPPPTANAKISRLLGPPSRINPRRRPRSLGVNGEINTGADDLRDGLFDRLLSLRRRAESMHEDHPCCLHRHADPQDAVDPPIVDEVILRGQVP